MKRFVFPIVLLSIAVFVLPAYADPLPKQVEVVNGPDNPVPVTMDQATVTVGNDSSNPVPVEMTEATVTISNDESNPVSVAMTDECGQLVTSAYIDIIGANYTPGPVIIVPTDSIFVLTDIVIGHNGGDSAVINISENQTTKFEMNIVFHDTSPYNPRPNMYSKSFHFNSGVPFASGSNVVVDNKTTSLKVLISGYLTTCF